VVDLGSEFTSREIKSPFEILKGNLDRRVFNTLMQSVLFWMLVYSVVSDGQGYVLLDFQPTRTGESVFKVSGRFVIS